jgi:hypothetical protein
VNATEGIVRTYFQLAKLLGNNLRWPRSHALDLPPLRWRLKNLAIFLNLAGNNLNSASPLADLLHLQME